MPERDYHRDNKSFLIYKDWKTAVDLLSNEQAGELFKALFAFAVNGESTQTNDAAFDALLNIMFQQIERDGEKFEAVCQKRSENGKKGGRPKKQTDNNKSKKSKRFFEKAKKADTETDTDIDTDIDTDREKNPSDSCAEQSEDAPAPAKLIVFSLPLNDGTEHSITRAEYDRYCSLYPAVDVMRELRKMAGWLDGNPRNRKTRAGIKRFINGWLSREQDRGRVQTQRVGIDRMNNRIPESYGGSKVL